MVARLISVSLHTCPPLFSGAITRGPSEKRLLVSLGRLPEGPLSNRSAGWPTPHRASHTKMERQDKMVGARGKKNRVRERRHYSEETRLERSNVKVWKRRVSAANKRRNTRGGSTTRCGEETTASRNV